MPTSPVQHETSTAGWWRTISIESKDGKESIESIESIESKDGRERRESRVND